MENRTFSFSTIIAHEIIQYIMHQSFELKLSKELLSSNNDFSKNFYSTFIDKTLEESIFSAITPTKCHEFELLERPKYLVNIDEDLTTEENSKKSLSLFSRIPIEKSQKINISSRSLKKMTISTQNRKEEKTLILQQTEKKKKYFSLNLKEKNKHFIKLKNENQNQKEHSTKETERIHHEMRNEKIQVKEKETQITKSSSYHQLIKKKSKSLPNENFPLLENINPINFEAFDKFNGTKSKKNTILSLNMSKNTKEGYEKTRLCISKSKTKEVKNEENEINEHERNSLEKFCGEEPRKKFVNMFGPRQRRSSQAKINSEIVRKIDECKVKNSLKIEPKKQNKNLKISQKPKKDHERLIISNKEAVNFLLNSSQKNFAVEKTESGIPNISFKHQNQISIKLI